MNGESGRDRPWLLLANSRAARAKTCLEIAAGTLQGAGVSVEIKAVDDADGVRRVAAESATQSIVLAVVGGDGSAGLAAGALAGGNAWLASLPGGTFNGLAKETGANLHPREAVGRLLAAAPEKWDLGFIGDRPFIQSAGIGIDGDLVARVEGKISRRSKVFSYVLGTLGLLARVPRQFSIESESGRIGGVYQAVFSNTSKWTFFMVMNPEADPGDGFLDLAVLPWRGRVARLGQFLSLTSAGRRWDLKCKPNRIKVKAARVIAEDGVFAQVDGEPMKVRDLQVTIKEKTLWVLNANR